jgi:TPR repeat protein
MARDQTSERGAPKPPGIVFASFLFVVGLICPFAIGIWAGLTEKHDELAALYLRGEFARLEQVVREGDPKAEVWMGRARQQQGRPAEAIEWFARAAEKGNRDAIIDLASLHEGESNLPEAIRWYERIAETGDQWAMAQLARIHHRENNWDESLHWFRRGAELGDVELQLKLARLYLDGEGVPRDEREAFRWYMAAASGNYSRARAYLPVARLYASGVGTARDLVEAYAYVELALTHTSSSQVWTLDKARALQSHLTTQLSPREIAEARRRARERRL